MINLQEDLRRGRPTSLPDAPIHARDRVEVALERLLELIGSPQKRCRRRQRLATHGTVQYPVRVWHGTPRLDREVAASEGPTSAGRRHTESTRRTQDGIAATGNRCVE